MRHTAICFLISLCAVLSATICRAGAQRAPQPPVFNQIFKQPTVQNGYEDLVLAGDLLYHNAVMEAIQAPDTTLTAKRRALADPDLQRALALVRAGLDKQIAAPHDSAAPEAPFPGILIRIFIPVARLLETEQYVLLADGQTARAIQSLRDGLRFGNAVRCQHVLLSRRIGVEIDRILVEQIARHLDQLSEHDCDSLLPLMREWLDVDHTPLAELINERDQLRQELGRVRKDPVSTLQEMRDEVDSEHDPSGSKLLEDASPSTLLQASDEAAELCSEQIDFAIANLKLPPWQRQDWQLPAADPLAHKLYRIVTPNLGSILQEDDGDRARLQLLGVHVAIRRYRWQYDRLPDRLEQLRLESLTADPFTGKPLGYRRNGNDYELYSVGPYQYDEVGARMPGQHTTIVLPH